MAKRLTSKQFYDESIYRQIKITRYINGQVKLIRGYVESLVRKLAKFVIAKSYIETKGQFNECRSYIKEQCTLYRDATFKHFEKELRKFIKEQAAWLYEYSPVKLKKVDIDKSMRNIFFEGFSDTDNIESYTTRIFNQIAQLWSTQLSIAYRTNLPMKEMVKLITGRNL